jgi:hypothetical protein
MAFTQPEKYTILGYLGWPVRTIDSTSTSYSNIIAGALANFPADAEDTVRDLLTKLDVIDQQLDSMHSRSNLKRFEDIEFFENGSADLRRERGKQCRLLACALDIALGPGFGGGNMVNIQI